METTTINHSWYAETTVSTDFHDARVAAGVFISDLHPTCGASGSRRVWRANLMLGQHTENPNELQKTMVGIVVPTEQNTPFHKLWYRRNEYALYADITNATSAHTEHSRPFDAQAGPCGTAQHIVHTTLRTRSPAMPV